MPNEDATTALHAVTESGEHLVGIGDLRVLLIEDHGSWYAQGLELDYVAQGATMEDAKTNFETGLLATISENLRILGSIRPMLKAAPDEIWMDMLDPKAKARRYFHLSIHEPSKLTDVSAVLPFKGIHYLRAEDHA